MKKKTLPNRLSKRVRSGMLCVAAVTMLLLTGCVSKSPSYPAFSHPRQGEYLYLPAGSKIHVPATEKGRSAWVYDVEQEEKWVSPEALRQCEDENDALRLALEHERLEDDIR